MANPLSNEAEIYEKIRKIVKKNDPNVNELLDYIWDLTDHHMGNEVYAIQLNIGSSVTGDDPEDIPADSGLKVLKNCDRIRSFFDKLKSATRLKE